MVLDWFTVFLQDVRMARVISVGGDCLHGDCRCLQDTKYFTRSILRLLGQYMKTRTTRCPVGEADDGKFVAKGPICCLRLSCRTR